MSGSFGPLPRLFARAGETSELELYLPQPTGHGLVVRAKGCERGQLRDLFGIKEVESIDLLRDEEELELGRISLSSWTFPCPAPKPLRTEYIEPGSWNIAVPSDATAGPGDGGTEAPAPIVLSVPQACDPLITHFKVRERALEERGLDGGVPAAPSVFLSCIKAGATKPKGAFSVDLVIARSGVPGGPRRPLLQITNGTATIYAHRADGELPDPNDQERTRRVLGSVGALLKIPSDRQTATLDTVAAPAVALDLCTKNCDGFKPSHLAFDGQNLVCADRSAPDAQGRCPSSAATFFLRERLDRDGVRVLDLTRSDDPSFRGGTFASCFGDGSWARPLGLTLEPGDRDLLEAAKKYYLAPVSAVIMPCVVDTDCLISLPTPTITDLPSVLGEIRRKCWQQQKVVTLQLNADMKATRSLVLTGGDPSNCGASSTSEQLPCSISTVRLVGERSGLKVTVPSRYCPSTPCQREMPAISVNGPLTLEVDGVSFHATNDNVPPVPQGSDPPKLNPALPGNRVAIEATRGATVVLRRASIGEAVPKETAVPLQLYHGIQLDGATLYAYQTHVRAYATAVSATRARVAIIGGESGELVDLSALGGMRRYADLFNLSGLPMAKPTDFTALRLEGTGARGFIARANIKAPVAITYIGPGSGSGDLSVHETRIGWNVGCAARAFVAESRTLLLYGTGELVFNAVDVNEMGRLIDCVDPARASVTFTQASTFKLVDTRIDPGRCQVRRQFEAQASTCPR